MTTRSRRLAALWFADLAGYTALSSVDEDQAMALVERLQEATRGVVPAHDGRIVKFVGDAVLAEFPSTGRADDALELLERVVADRDPAALQIGVEPAFDVLHDDPRFVALLERIGIRPPLSSPAC